MAVIEGEDPGQPQPLPPPEPVDPTTDRTGDFRFVDRSGGPFRQPDPDRADWWKVQLLSFGEVALNDRANMMADQLAKLEQDWPELGDMAEQDFARAVRMTDRDRILLSVESAQKTAEGVPESLTEATYEELALYYSQLGKFVGDVDDIMTAAGDKQIWLDDVQRIIIKPAAESAANEALQIIKTQGLTSDDVVVKHWGNDTEMLANLNRQFREEAEKFRGRDAFFGFDPTSRLLAVGLRIENPEADDPGQPDVNTFTEILRIDEGTSVSTTFDMLRELVLADLGLKHEVIEGGDFPGQRTVAGRIIKSTVGDATRILGDRGGYGTALLKIQEAQTRLFNMDADPGVVDPTVADYLAAGTGLDVVGGESIANFKGRYLNEAVTSERIVAIGAAMLREEGRPQEIALAESELRWEQASEDEKRAAVEAVRVGSVKELDEALSELSDERTTLEKGVGATLEGIGVVFETWDKAIHAVGIEVLQKGIFFGELFGLFDWNEGVNEWAKDVAAVDTDSVDYVSELLGIDDPAYAFWADITYSIAGDPAMWWFASGKAATQMGMRLFADPALNQLAKKHPFFLKGIRQMHKADKFARFNYAVDGRMTGEGAIRFVFHDGPVEELAEIAIRQTPGAGNGGFFLPPGGAHVTQRNSSLGFFNLVQKGSKTRKGQGKVSAMLNNASAGRSIPIGVDNISGVGRLLETIYFKDPDQTAFKGAVEKFFREMSAVEGTRKEQLVILRQDLDNITGSLDDLGAQFPAGVRQFGKVKAELEDTRGLFDAVNKELPRAEARAAANSLEEPAAAMTRGTLASLGRKIERLESKTLSPGLPPADPAEVVPSIDEISAFVTGLSEQELDRAVGLVETFPFSKIPELDTGPFREAVGRYARRVPDLPRGVASSAPGREPVEEALLQLFKDFDDLGFPHPALEKLVTGRNEIAAAARAGIVEDFEVIQKSEQAFLQSQFDEYIAQSAELSRRLETTNTAIERASVPGSRLPLVQFVRDELDAKLVRLGAVDEAGKADPGVVIERLYGARPAEGFSKHPDMLAYYFKDNEKLLEAMKGVMQRDITHVTLPVSPQDLIAFEAGFKFRPLLQGKLHLSQHASRLHKWFVTNFLAAPMTIIRSNIGDDPMRIATITGVRGRKAHTGFKINQETGLVDNVYTKTAGLPRQILPNPPFAAKHSMWSKDMSGLTSWGKAAGIKELPLPIDRTLANPNMYDMIQPTDKGFVGAAQQFVEAHLANLPGANAFAESTLKGNREAFNAWWEKGGAHMQAGIKVGLGTTPGEFALSISKREDIWSGLQHMFDTTAAGRSAVSDALYKAVARNEPISKGIYRQMGPVWGMPYFGAVRDASGAISKTDKRLLKGLSKGRTDASVLEWMYRRGYSLPAGVRRGTMVENLMSDANTAFLKAYEGRVMDAHTLMSRGIATDIAEATFMIENNAPALSQLLDEGFMTHKLLEVKAYQYASDIAQRNLYHPGAASIWGRSWGRTIAPFERAHLDYLSWWGYNLTNGSWLSLQPTVQNALAKLSGGATRNLPILGRPVAMGGKTAFSTPPLNVRLLSRTALGLAESVRQVEALQNDFREGRKGPLSFQYKAFSPGELIKRFTFTPTEFGLGMLIDIVPGLGPIPVGAIHLLAPDHPIRKALETLFPALQFDASQQSLTDFHTNVFPTRGGASVSSVIATGGDYLFPRLTGASPSLFREPRMRRQFTKGVFAEHLLETKGAIVDPQLEGFNEIVNQTMSKAELLATEHNALDKYERLSPFGSIGYPDAPHIVSFTGFMDNVLEDFNEQGFFPDDVTADLTDIWDKFQKDHATTEERQFFINRALNTLFGPSVPDEKKDEALVLAPDLAVNFVGMSSCNYNDDGSGQGGLDCRVNGTPIWPNDQRAAAEASEEAFNRGWVTEKPIDQWHAEVFYRQAQARANVLRRMISDRLNIAKPDRKNKESATLSKETGAMPTIILPGENRLLNAMGIPVTGRRRILTLKELEEKFEPHRDVPRDPANWVNPFISGINRAVGNPNADTFIQTYEGLKKLFDREGVSPDEWPEGIKELMREQVRTLIDDGITTEGNYRKHMGRLLGDLSYEPPQPPPLSGLTKVLFTDQDSTPRERVHVIDGDTVRVLLDDGEWTSVRLMGVNAPDAGQDGYLNARDDLIRLLDDARSIVFGVFDTERFGTVNFPDVDRSVKRFKLWLYVDGEVIWHPETFTANNPLGVELGGKYIPIGKRSDVEEES